MTKPSIKDLQKLIAEIVLPFYRIERLTPLNFSVPRRENDAEHSWSLALVACAMAPHIDKHLDIGLIAQLAIVHDLVEVYAGDTSNFASADEKASKNSREKAALEKLTTEFALFPWIIETVHRYEVQQLPEAQFVKSVDKIIPLVLDVLDEGAVYKEHKMTLEAWKEAMQEHRQKAGSHAGAYKYYSEIWDLIVSQPHFFYH